VATLRDHSAGQDGDASALFNRGAKVGKRASESETKEELAFVPVRVEERQVNAGPGCRFRHAGGHELEIPHPLFNAWLEEGRRSSHLPPTN
jgi:hypothetical protein